MLFIYHVISNAGGVSATRPTTQHPSGPGYTTLAPKPGNTDKDPCTTEFGAIMHGQCWINTPLALSHENSDVTVPQPPWLTFNR